MAKKTSVKHIRGDKLVSPKPLAIAKPKFDDLLRKVSKPKSGKK